MILKQEEKLGEEPRSAPVIDQFRSGLVACNLSDIGYTVDPFTWTNNRAHPYNVRCRLDRVCSNSEWLNLFPDSKVVHLSLPESDHLPILFQSRRMDSSSFGKQAKPFRFEAHCISKADYEDVIKNNWDMCFDLEV